MVHRPFRLAEIFSKMVAYHIEPKRIRLVYPFVDKEPNMVLIEGLRGGKSPPDGGKTTHCIQRAGGIYAGDL